LRFRTIVVCYLIIMVAIFALLWTQGRSGNSYERNMLRYNQLRQEAEDAYNNGGAIPEKCEIIELNDPHYLGSVNQAFKKNSLVMDIFSDEDGSIVAKVVIPDAEEYTKEMRAEFYRKSLMIWGITALGGSLILLFVYVAMIRPFKKLKGFAGAVAKGNLDMPLKMNRNNYFGAFTESFDIMREELIASRESLAAANKARHETVAELSHDIRTPVATIKATCDVLEIKSKDPDTLAKVRVISSKADTIDRLVGNMLTATLEELENLSVDVSEQPSTLISDMIETLKIYGDIRVEGEIPGCLLLYDPLRLEQVIDNIVNNSLKYAGTAVTFTPRVNDDGLLLTIRDYGSGIPDDEIAVVTEKFYRGHNSAAKPGTGLGLYLAETFMRAMGGEMVLHNDGGLVVELFIRKAGARKSPVAVESFEAADE